MSIIIENLSYTYMPKTPYEKQALNNISFEIAEGEFVGLVGATGSGKSTLIQHLNGLIKLKDGKITVFDIDLSQKKVDYNLVRKGIGMLFQYPEYQLFDETVLKDVMFGPKNFGMSEEDAYLSAKLAIEQVGLDFEDISVRSPFELSGGQKRRVAMAGVLAYNPQILILDEPTSGLDPIGKRDILNLISKLKSEKKIKTIIMISHNMDEIAEFTQRVIVLHNSKLIFDLPTIELFEKEAELIEMGLDIPVTIKIRNQLIEKGVQLAREALTIEQLHQAIKMALRGKMTRDISFGQYYPGDSFIHKMDPRAKILLSILYITMVFLCNSFISYFIAFSFVVFTAIVSQVPLKSILKSVKSILFLVVLTATINILFYREGEVLFKLWKIIITKEGLIFASKMALRLLLLVTGTTLVTLTTTPMNLTDGMESLMSPLKKIKFPVHDVAIIMNIALRFVPSLMEEIDKIMMAQKARGASFDSGGLIKRARSFLPILIPLFVSAFRRADELALALDARCYNATQHRTKMKVLKLSYRDFIASIVAIIFLGGIITLKILL